MANESWVGNYHQGLAAPTTVTYFAFCSSVNGNTTEAPAQIIVPAGTFDLLSIYVSANSGTTGTIRFRVGGANVNQIISIGSGLTGWFQDTTHTDVVTNGNLCCMSVIAAGAGITLNGTMSMRFTPSSGGAVSWYGQGSDLMSFTSNNAAEYSWLAGLANAQSATESQVQHKWRAPGTLSHLSYHSSTNTLVKTRINGADGTLVIPDSGSGRQTDTTHSDALADGDLVCIVTDDADSFKRHSQMYVRFTSSDGKFETATCVRASGFNTGTRYASIFGGTNGTVTTEADAQAKVPMAMNASKLRVNVASNGGSGSGTSVWTLRKEGSSTALTITVPFATTGQFEDTTNTVSFAAGDRANLLVLGNQTSGSVAGSITILWAAGTPPAGDGVMEFNPLSIEGAGDVSPPDLTGTGAMLFSPLSLEGTAVNLSSDQVRQFWTFGI